MRLDRLRVFTKKVNKEFGYTIDHARNMRAMNIPRLLTGSLSFDFALGGGIPIGRSVLFHGEESSGKTSSALRIAGLAQHICSHCYRFVEDLEVVEDGYDEDTGEVLYAQKGHCDCYNEGIFKPKQHHDETNRDFNSRIKRYKENSYEEFRVAFFDYEGTFDSAWAQALGVDDRLVLRVVPGTAEEGIDIYDELIRTGAIGLFINDSIAAMIPSREAEDSAENAQVGLQARLVNKFVRRVTCSANEVEKEFGSLTTQIWINQEREMIGGSAFGDNTTIPGGKGQRFGASVIVKTWSSKWSKEKLDADLIKDFQIDMSTEVRQNFKIVKNKTAPAKMRGGFILKIAGSKKGTVDETKYIIQQAIKYGYFAEKEVGNKKVWILGDEEFKKKASVLARIEQPEVLRGLKAEILREMIEGLGKE